MLHTLTNVASQTSLIRDIINFVENCENNFWLSLQYYSKYSRYLCLIDAFLLTSSIAKGMDLHQTIGSRGVPGTGTPTKSSNLLTCSTSVDSIIALISIA